MERDPDIPDNDPNNLVQREYERRLWAMSVPERFARVCELFEFARGMLRRQIEAETPGLSEKELNLRVAERMYADDPETLKLLAMARRR